MRIRSIETRSESRGWVGGGVSERRKISDCHLGPTDCRVLLSPPFLPFFSFSLVSSPSSHLPSCLTYRVSVMMNGVAGGRHLFRDSVLGESINPLDGCELIYSYAQSDNIANYYLLGSFIYCLRDFGQCQWRLGYYFPNLRWRSERYFVEKFDTWRKSRLLGPLAKYAGVTHNDLKSPTFLPLYRYENFDRKHFCWLIKFGYKWIISQKFLKFLERTVTFV